MMSLRPRNPPVVAAEPKDQENLVKLAGKHPQLTRVSGTVTHRAALGDIQNRLGGQNLPAGKKKSLDLEKKPLKAVGKPSLAHVQAKVDTRRPLRTSRTSSSSTSIPAPKPTVVAASTSSTKDETVAFLPSSTTSVDDHNKSCEAMELGETQSPSKDAGYSSDLLQNVNNIDVNDQDLPLLVSEYVNDIYVYLRKLETDQFVKDNYLDQQPITGRMRQILIDWLMQVHLRFSLLPETMYMTVAIIDRYLQEKPCTKDKLQLVGVAAMLLASKYEEIYAPEINDFVYITDRCYTAKEIRVMEIDILKNLQFNLGRPLPIHFLRRYSKAADADAKTHMMAKYLMELCLVDYSMVAVLPSKLAASALYLVHVLLGEKPWNDTLTFYSKYTPDDLLSTVKQLAKVVVKAHSPTCKTRAIRNKYSASKYMAVSEMECFFGPELKQLASSSESTA